MCPALLPPLALARAGCLGGNGLTASNVLLQGCAQDNAGAASDPNSFALTGDFIAGEYVLEVRPNPPANEFRTLSCDDGTEGTYNLTLIEGSIDISPRIVVPIL